MVIVASSPPLVDARRGRRIRGVRAGSRRSGHAEATTRVAGDDADVLVVHRANRFDLAQSCLLRDCAVARDLRRCGGRREQHDHRGADDLAAGRARSRPRPSTYHARARSRDSVPGGGSAEAGLSRGVRPSVVAIGCPRRFGHPSMRYASTTRATSSRSGGKRSRSA